MWPSWYTITAIAKTYLSQSQSVTLTASQTLDFTLRFVNVDPVPLPKAQLDDVGPIDADTTDGSKFAVIYKGINKGDGCAGSVVGTTEYRDRQQNLMASITWFLSPPTAIVRPGQLFHYVVCCLTKDQMDQANTPNSYSTRFTWTDVDCWSDRPSPDSLAKAARR